MHSNRMRTARSLSASRSIRRGGIHAQGAMHAQGVCMPWGVHGMHTPLLTDRQL